MPTFPAPKGTHDILTDQYYAREYIARTILRVLEKYGFRQVMTPAFEEIEVLKAKAGEQILEQIYEFRDKGNRHLGLRSDITASVGRLIAPQMGSLSKPVKISCYDRVWRYESPQSGRYREFFQINAEMFGASDAISDAELLACFCECYDAVGLTNYKIHIGHRALLENFIKALGVGDESLLAVIRAVDKAPKLGKKEFEIEVTKAGLSIDKLGDLDVFTNLRGSLDQIIAEAKAHYYSLEAVRPNLDQLSYLIDNLKLYKVDSKCVLDLAIARGSDYYTGVIFECVYNTKLVGSIGGGGRYDNLIEIYGGPRTPATGFSIGFERVMTLLNQLESFDSLSFVPQVDYYVVPIDCSCLSAAIDITQMLRARNKNVELDLLSRKVKAQFSHASKLGARWVIVIGPDELATNQVRLRNMSTGKEQSMIIQEFINHQDNFAV